LNCIVRSIARIQILDKDVDILESEAACHGALRALFRTSGSNGSAFSRAMWLMPDRRHLLASGGIGAPTPFGTMDCVAFINLSAIE
jgi:hypothetical protein